MGDEQLNQGQEESEQGDKPRYETILNPAVVEEQPFYRKGMTAAEIQRELDYLNQNLPSFFDGSYMPLWKQGMYR